MLRHVLSAHLPKLLLILFAAVLDRLDVAVVLGQNVGHLEAPDLIFEYDAPKECTLK